MMQRDKAIEKIRKCLALSASSNEHEAATALRQAQALMREFSVSESQVAAAEATESSCLSGVKSQPPQHLVVLARTCANAFACDFLIGSELRGQTMTFVGTDPGPRLAQYAYTVLRRALERDRKAYVATLKRCQRKTKIRRGQAFALTWVIAVAQTVQEFAGTDADRQRIAAYTSEHYPSLASMPVRQTRIHGRDDAALEAGFRRGETQSLHRPINGQRNDQRRLR
ncbi:MAG: hypothetical protein CMP08_07805 [Xanthomonadales bacterium]|nr:hypothetical protein [Xanthomonadales bacterium]|tara:strand:+ start:871 stop:1548 length:678 start_codon:yes stop_codon:yes gene_type:complete